MILANINLGSGPSAGDGDPLRTAFTKVNNNFKLISSDVNSFVNSVTTVAGRTGNVTLTSNDIIGFDGVSLVNVSPAVTSTYIGDLGEFVYDSTLKALRIQDGITDGGFIAYSKYSPAGNTGNTTADWNTIINKPPQTFTAEFINTNTINITHNMEKYPGVRVVDTANSLWIPNEITYNSLNSLTITLTVQFSGTVFLS